MDLDDDSLTGGDWDEDKVFASFEKLFDKSPGQGSPSFSQKPKPAPPENVSREPENPPRGNEEKQAKPASEPFSWPPLKPMTGDGNAASASTPAPAQETPRESPPNQPPGGFGGNLLWSQGAGEKSLNPWSQEAREESQSAAPPSPPPASPEPAGASEPSGFPGNGDFFGNQPSFPGQAAAQRDSPPEFSGMKHTPPPTPPESEISSLDSLSPATAVAAPPREDEILTVHCPVCQAPLTIPRQYLGVNGACVSCNLPIVAIERGGNVVVEPLGEAAPSKPPVSVLASSKEAVDAEETAAVKEPPAGADAGPPMERPAPQSKDSNSWGSGPSGASPWESSQPKSNPGSTLWESGPGKEFGGGFPGPGRPPEGSQPGSAGEALRPGAPPEDRPTPDSFETSSPGGFPGDDAAPWGPVNTPSPLDGGGFPGPSAPNVKSPPPSEVRPPGIAGSSHASAEEETGNSKKGKKAKTKPSKAEKQYRQKRKKESKGSGAALKLVVLLFLLLAGTGAAMYYVPDLRPKNLKGTLASFAQKVPVLETLAVRIGLLEEKDEESAIQPGGENQMPPGISTAPPSDVPLPDKPAAPKTGGQEGPQKIQSTPPAAARDQPAKEEDPAGSSVPAEPRKVPAKTSPPKAPVQIAEGEPAPGTPAPASSPAGTPPSPDGSQESGIASSGANGATEKMRTNGEWLLRNFYEAKTMKTKSEQVLSPVKALPSINQLWGTLPENHPTLGAVEFRGLMRDAGTGWNFGVFDVYEPENAQWHRWCVVEPEEGVYKLDWGFYRQLSKRELGNYLASPQSEPITLRLLIRRGELVPESESPWNAEAVELQLTMPLDQQEPATILMRKTTHDILGLAAELPDGQAKIAEVELSWVNSDKTPGKRVPTITRLTGWGAWQRG